jgi:predicted transcriptional regulator
VGDLLEKVFSGSVSSLVMHALGSKKTSAAEVQEIRRMLDQLAPDAAKSKPKSKP